MMILRFFFLIALLLPHTGYSQSAEQIGEEIEDDLNTEGDIFTDFNEDLESAQVLEDERFYRYGRFFSVNIGGGFTTFTGNRGVAFKDNPPSFHLSMSYFLDFQQAVILGVEYSKHTMILDTVVNGFQELGPLGAVTQDQTRVFTGYKYYIDTTDLGTAITYSNPHLIGRLEYWYTTTKFIDQDTLPREKGGGLGTGIGFGLEFPIELKRSYVSVEALYHVVNFDDKFTQNYRQVEDNPDTTENEAEGSTFGYEDLTGNVLSLMVTYNITW